MRCTHSTVPGTSPDRCSLCLGIAARVVRFDEKKNTLTIDGIPVGDLPAPKPRVRQKTGTKALGRRRCGRCGRLGHSRRKCNEQPTQEATDAIGDTE